MSSRLNGTLVKFHYRFSIITWKGQKIEYIFQLSALFLFNIQEIVVPLSLQKSCNIKYVMAYDTK